MGFHSLTPSEWNCECIKASFSETAESSILLLSSCHLVYIFQLVRWGYLCLYYYWRSLLFLMVLPAVWVISESVIPVLLVLGVYCDGHNGILSSWSSSLMKFIFPYMFFFSFFPSFPLSLPLPLSPPLSQYIAGLLVTSCQLHGGNKGKEASLVTSGSAAPALGGWQYGMGWGTLEEEVFFFSLGVGGGT